VNDSLVDVRFLDDALRPGEDTNDRLKRLTEFLLKTEYFDELGHARVLYGTVGVSNKTLTLVDEVNRAKISLLKALPGSEAMIHRTSFNRVVARMLEPELHRLNWEAVTRQMKVIPRKTTRPNGPGTMSLKAIRLSTQDHYKAKRIPLEELYAYVGAITEKPDRRAALAALPSATGVEKEDMVIQRGPIRTQGVVNASYWLESEERVFSRNFKTSTPIFYSVEGPDLIVEASSRVKKNPDVESAQSRLILETDDHAFYRISTLVLH